MTSSTLVQKQVGHTMVQLPHVRHRLATSSQCGDSRDSISSSRRSPGGHLPAHLVRGLRDIASCRIDFGIVGVTMRQRGKHVGAVVAADVHDIAPTPSSMRSVSARS